MHKNKPYIDLSDPNETNKEKKQKLDTNFNPFKSPYDDKDL